MEVLTLLALFCCLQHSYGQGLRIEDHPSAVHIEIMFSDHIGHCDGTIASEKFVITAAICLIDTYNSARVIASTANIKDLKDYYSSSAKPTLHPNYKRGAADYNIGLVKTDMRMRFVKNINIARPAQLASADSKVTVGAVLTVVGWGRDSENSQQIHKNLGSMSIQVMSLEQCQSVYSSKNVIITSRSFCASYTQGRGEGCAGDIGASVVDNNNVLVGIVSSGAGCARQGLPPIYTDVASMRGWIKSVASI